MKIIGKLDLLQCRYGNLTVIMASRQQVVAKQQRHSYKFSDADRTLLTDAWRVGEVISM